MTDNQILERIIEIVSPHVKNMNLELVDVEYLQEGGYWYVRIFIENLNGDIGIDECEKLTRLVEDKIDDLIDKRFFLEVSSPGLERPLKKIEDYIRFKNSKIFLSLHKKIGDNKNFEGILKDVIDDNIIVNIDGIDMKFEFKSIRKANLVFDFDNF